jgi:hypothetical protein
MSGELKKMKIKAIDKDGNVIKENGSELSYDALVNPESYKVNHIVTYSPAPSPPGSIAQDQQFVRMMPTTFQFDFLFDSTGVVPKPLEGIAGALSGVPVAGAIAGAVAGLLSDEKKYDILEEIEKFKKIVYLYNGKSHSPRTVRLIWGALLFDGKLTSLNFNFKLFKPDGTPMRVVASTAFRGTMEDDLQKAVKKNNSPDLTHIRIVNQGDTLPLMTYRIYGNPAYYLEVARFNNLANFRNLKPGDKILFPPIDKSNK